MHQKSFPKTRVGFALLDSLAQVIGLLVRSKLIGNRRGMGLQVQILLGLVAQVRGLCKI